MHVWVFVRECVYIYIYIIFVHCRSYVSGFEYFFTIPVSVYLQFCASLSKLMHHTLRQSLFYIGRSITQFSSSPPRFLSHRVSNVRQSHFMSTSNLHPLSDYVLMAFLCTIIRVILNVHWSDFINNTEILKSSMFTVSETMLQKIRLKLLSHV